MVIRHEHLAFKIYEGHTNVPCLFSECYLFPRDIATSFGPLTNSFLGVLFNFPNPFLSPFLLQASEWNVGLQATQTYMALGYE